MSDAEHFDPRVEQLLEAFLALNTEDKLTIATALMKGFLATARAEKKLAPTLAGLMQLECVMILVGDKRGPLLESTSHDNAHPAIKELMRGLHEMVAAEIDRFAIPVSGPAAVRS